MKEKCENCRYWNEQYKESDGFILGDCRRKPPKLNVKTMNDYADSVESPEEARWMASIFPTTVMHDWCGEWKGGDKVLDDLDPDVVERHLLEIRERMAKHDDGHITDD